MKKLILIAIVFLVVKTLAQIPTNGLQVSYPFTNGSTNDFSPNNNHLTPSNGPTSCPDRFNNPNCAYLFDGINDFMTAINPGPKYKKSRSVSFWAKTTAVFNSNGYVALYYGNTSVGGGRFELGLNSGCNGLYADYGFGYITKPFNTIDNNWHMYTVVYDSTVSYGITSVLYYMDANLVSTTCMTYNTTQTINTQMQDPITIGRMTATFPRNFNGALDDIHVYDRPLTPAEVVTLYTTAACAGPPAAPTAVLGTQTICSGSSLVYSISPISTATSYSWSLPGGWSGSSSNTIINVNASSNPGSISVIAINSCGQSSATIINITVDPSPTISIATNGTAICNGNSMNLSGNGASTYTWNTSSNNQSITVSPTVTTTYTLSGSNSFGCSSSAVKTVIVNNFPLPNISVTSPGASCAGQSVNIASNGAQTYTWQPGNMNGFQVTVSPTLTTNYTVTGIDANGCYNSTVFAQTVIDCGGDASLITNTLPGQNIVIVPNPASDQFEIKGIEVDEIIIYDVVGKFVGSAKTEDARGSICVSTLTSGIYFVHIKAGEQSFVKKLMKD